MKTFCQLLVFFLFFLCCQPIGAQHLQTFIPKRATPAGKMPLRNPLLNGPACNPDSIHLYVFISPSDSILAQRQLYKKYGAEAQTQYIYEPMGDGLVSIDSTVYNAGGQLVFNELWEFNYDSNAVVIEERGYYYPHAGPVTNDYFFPAAITQLLEPQPNEALFDSIVLETKDFFSGWLQPETKTINIYDANNRVQEKQTFFWDPFSSMSWFLSDKTLYTYTASNRVSKVEEYSWNGLSFVLHTTGNYTYDANDSLVNVQSNSQPGGEPEQKLEMTYNPGANSTRAIFFGWDAASSSWMEVLNILGDYDEQGRLETMEYVLDFFGSTDGIKLEYNYLDDSPCPWYSRLSQYTGGGNWMFVGKYYYFPLPVSSSTDIPQAAWKIYPNPAGPQGIRVETEPGTFLQLTTLQGEILYRGFATGTSTLIDCPKGARQLVLSIGEGKSMVSRVILVQE